MPWEAPRSAKSIPVRPLDKGMMLNSSSQVIPDGAFLTLENMIASKEGPKRRPGYEDIASGQVLSYRPIDMLTLVAPSGDLVALLLTSHSLYRVDMRTGYTEVPWAYNSGTITIYGGTVTGLGTFWRDNDIQSGDLLRVGGLEVEILTVSSNTAMVINTGVLSDGSGISYSIQRTFQPGILNSPTWAATPFRVAIADGKHKLLGYDLNTGTLGYWTTVAGKDPPNGAVIPAVVSYFSDRVYQGNIIDPVEGEVRSRILWSTLADDTDFSVAANYMDLPYSGGNLMGILGLGDLLMFYYDDAVYAGYPTNYPNLPFRPVRLETGKIGLVSTRGVGAYLGGHMFVGQNDFYFTDGKEIKGLGDPIARELLPTMENPGWSYVAADVLNSSVLFGVSDIDDKISRIWRMDSRTGAWSYDPISTEMITNPIVNAALAWDTLTGSWDDLGTTYASWNKMAILDTQRRVIVESGRQLWRESIDGAVDFGSASVPVVIETKDHDFGDPDSSKTFVWLSLKIDWNNVLTDTLMFNVSVSTNRGRTWKSGGTMYIAAGHDEGWVNFRATGSTMRFKLTSSSGVGSYYISEYTLRVVKLGDELDMSLQ